MIPIRGRHNWSKDHYLQIVCYDIEDFSIDAGRWCFCVSEENKKLWRLCNFMWFSKNRLINLIYLKIIYRTISDLVEVSVWLHHLKELFKVQRWNYSVLFIELPIPGVRLDLELLRKRKKLIQWWFKDHWFFCHVRKERMFISVD